MGMNVTYVQFCTSLILIGSTRLADYIILFTIDRGMKAQGIDRKKLVYHSNLQPWLAYWGIFWNTIFILVNGFECFWDFTASAFLTACTSIAIPYARCNLIPMCSRRHQHPAVPGRLLWMEDLQTYQGMVSRRDGFRNRHPDPRGDRDT